MTDDKSQRERGIEAVAIDVLQCALSWEPTARLLGNVTAHDIARLARASIGREQGRVRNAVGVAMNELPLRVRIRRWLCRVGLRCDYLAGPSGIARCVWCDRKKS